MAFGGFMSVLIEESRPHLEGAATLPEAHLCSAPLAPGIWSWREVASHPRGLPRGGSRWPGGLPASLTSAGALPLAAHELLPLRKVRAGREGSARPSAAPGALKDKNGVVDGEGGFLSRGVPAHSRGSAC